MSLIRFAREGVMRLPIGEEGDWLDVREEISKGVFRQIMQTMPQKELDTSEGSQQKLRLTQGEAIEYQGALFAALVVAWSAEGEPTVENYFRLDTDSAKLIDEALSNHFADLTPSRDEAKKPSTSPARQRRG